MSAETTHYYPVSRAIGYFFGGALLLAVAGGLFVSGVPSLWAVFGIAMAAVAIWLGVRGVLDRKKYPMLLSDELISFYVRKRKITVPLNDIAAVFYNTKGIDKRASLRKTDGEVIDIPVLYGLNDLVEKLRVRYNLPRM